MSMPLSRRSFLVGLGAAGAAAALADPSAIRVGYAAITWGGDDERAIREIGQAGFSGILVFGLR